jgi:ABC-2 type transport system permease protein
MKQFLLFVRKEFLHVLRDPRTLMILFGMPVVSCSLVCVVE